MRRRPLIVTVLPIAGVALLVVLFFVFRGSSDGDGATTTVAVPTVATRPTLTAPTVTTTTGKATTRTEPAKTATPSGPVPKVKVARLVIGVRNGKPVGGVQHARAEKNEWVAVLVDSDTPDEVHVHGYDRMEHVAPESPATILFRATIQGRFLIELEHAGTPIAELEVR